MANESAGSLVLNTVIKSGQIRESDPQHRHLELPFKQLRKVSKTTGIKYVSFRSRFGEWIFSRTTLEKVLTSIRKFDVSIRLTEITYFGRKTPSEKDRKAYVKIDYTKPCGKKGHFLLLSLQSPFPNGEILEVNFPQGSKK